MSTFRRTSALRRSTSLALTLMLLTSLTTFAGPGAAAAVWAPAYVERVSQADMSVRPLPAKSQYDPDISADGTYVAFETEASNLGPVDDNGRRDIYVADVATGKSRIVSVSSTETLADGNSDDAAVSADGRDVVFSSQASNLVPNDTNNDTDVFLRDTTAGMTYRVSVSTAGDEGNSDSYDPRVSGTGRHVVFDSYATNLVVGDTNVERDVFVHDIASGETTRASTASDGSQGNDMARDADISADGRFVVFESDATNLAAGATNGYYHVICKDLVSGESTLVSAAANGTQGNNSAYDPRISDDGRYVVFESYASNLVPSDTNSSRDIFIKDLQTGAIDRVSVHSNGSESSGSSENPGVSGDGRYVVFVSGASDLVDGDTNDHTDSFRHDTVTGQTVRVSVAHDGEQPDSSSYDPSVSADGQNVAFESSADNVVANMWTDETNVYVRKVADAQTILLCRSAQAMELPARESEFSRLSADGRYVVFHSEAGNLIPDDTNGDKDVFLYDRDTRNIELISVSTTGTQGNGCSSKPSVSADGRYVVFQSDSTNLSSDDRLDSYTPQGDNGDIYLRDRVLGTTTIVSPAVTGVTPLPDEDNCAVWPSINASGTHIVYRSIAQELVDDDTNEDHDIFYYSIASGEATRATVTYDGGEFNDGDPSDGNGTTHFPAISGNGRYVAFRTNESSVTTDPLIPGADCGDGDSPPQIYVRDMQMGTNKLASISTTGSGADKSSRWPSLSGDGRYVAFQSGATNLVAGDTNGYADIFVRDLQSGETTRVSVATGGGEGDNCSSNPMISGNGRYVAFRSYAENLVADDDNGCQDVFVHDLQTGETKRVSVSIEGTQGDDDCDYARPSISYDGEYISFESEAGNLVTGDEFDSYGNNNIFVVSMTTIPDPSSVDRAAGTDRYATAIAASVANFDAADTAILATGMDFPDALSASGLAGALDAPLLLTPPAALPGGLDAELTRLGVSDVIVVGGTSVVTGNVATQLTNLGYTVDRIGGANRYETAAFVAEAIETELGAAFPHDAFVVRGDTFPDALAAAPFSYNAGIPILLTQPTALPGATAAALGNRAIDDVVIVGGTAAVSAPVAVDIAGQITGAVTREAGPNRYATAVEVADRGMSEGWGDDWFIGLATGDNFPDALAGGATCGANGGMLLLTRRDALPGEVSAFMTRRARHIVHVEIYGGAVAVDVTVANEVAAIIE